MCIIAILVEFTEIIQTNVYISAFSSDVAFILHFLSQYLAISLLLPSI